MNCDDERLRDSISDGLAQAAIDARTLTIDVIGGAVIIRGSVDSEDTRHRLGQAVAVAVPGLAWRIDVGIRRAGKRQHIGRGRPFVGPSDSKGSESRHRID